MARVAHLLVFFTLTLQFREAASYFPTLRDLAQKSSIRSSSTCGQTSSKYCDASSLSSRTCTEKVCHYGCCSTCTSSTPSSHNLGASSNTLYEIYSGEPRPGKTSHSLGFDSLKDSKIEVRRLPSIDHKNKGFTICVWVNQSHGNTGTIVSKYSVTTSSVIYGVVLADYSVTLHYIPEGSNLTENVQVVPLASQYPRNPNEWHFITVMVFNTELSYFLDGEYVGKAGLRNPVDDGAGRLTVGQMYSGDYKYDGLMQDIFLYAKALTNREVIEVFTGTFPSTYIASECRCPPSHPKISTKLPAKCGKNSDSTESSLVSRLSETSHPIEFATDFDPVTYWLSELTNEVTIDIDLLYGLLQVIDVISIFYGTLPEAIFIERSFDFGQTYHPWQYFAQSCVKSFGMPDNGKLDEPDSVNCLQYLRPYKYDAASVAFRPENPGKDNVSLRPYGPGCNSLYCSPKLLGFIRATSIRIHFYNHTLVNEADAKYFGLYRLLISGRCECYGHAEVAEYITGNGTNNGSCVCQCHPSTNSEGTQCNRCKPLFNNKPFRRGSTTNPFPCVKCQCYNHTDSCYYNRTLDPNPNDRTRGGGGVCINCLHNTAGQHCEKCKEKFYRKARKALDDPGVCVPCRCSGPGVKTGAQDCVKDNSDPSVSPGQCQCKDNVMGHLCDQCKPGYYNLTSPHDHGCVSCSCDPRGTTNGDVTCDVTTGQCNCKANVTGRRCDQCKATFYNLHNSSSNGCQTCQCNLIGATSSECDKVSGQCPCKSRVTGRQCERCESTFHRLNFSGCEPCNCSPLGSLRCHPLSGRCQCKNYVSGYSCDRCAVGYYNLRGDNSNGCTPCPCDTKGTLGNTRECHAITGSCMCKSNVTGANCGQCPAGFFNLSSANPNGCQPCRCYPKGTKDGNSRNPDKLDCLPRSGQCVCLANVKGTKCDECDEGYVWNQAGQGCIPCNCDPYGSVSRTCNETGFCDCRSGNGVGGQFCSQCLPGYHSFNRGNCSPCYCNKAGIKKDECDAVRCLHCKENVEGTRCDRCKPGTRNLKQENPFGCSGVPSQQGPPFVHVVNSRTLGIAWDPPDQPNGLITNYVLYRNGSRVYSGLSRHFNDTGLRPYTLYAYYLITHADGGSLRSLPDGRVYRTAQDVPSGVAPPNITRVFPRTAKAVWSYPATPNGIIREFFLESVYQKDSSVNVHCHGLFLTCDVTHLRPYTVYNFTIRVCTDVGCTTSQANIVLTRPTAPDSQPAPVVTPLSGGKMFLVYWDEPSEPNGVIFRYELYRRNYPPQPGDRITLVFYSSSANPGDVLLRNITVRGLVPFTLYEFRVVSFSAQVSGDTASNWTKQRTAEAVPEGESAINPQSYAVSSSQVNVSWHLPSTPYGIIVRSNVYIYTNETSYLNPVLALTVNASSSALVGGLLSYTIYVFTVTSCNSVGCTKHSSKTQTRTLASAPAGQEAPHGNPLNATHIHLTWRPPTRPNGPVPPVYQVSRSRAAFYYPPINAIAGTYFPGLGYYRFSSSVIPPNSRTDIELFFKTRYSNGLLVFLASVDQDDFLAVELRNGIPWFIFDCQTGVAEITVVNSSALNDERWHHLKITRDRRNGKIVVDGSYEGRGTSAGPSTVIGENTGVYIGGITDLFQPKGSITRFVHSVGSRTNFIGCLKDLRLQSKEVRYQDADEKVGVDPLSSGCPLDLDRGVYLKGGGFFSLKKGVFTGRNLYTLSFNFKTHYVSGLLLFTYGESPGQESYLALVLDLGDIRVLYRTTCCYGNFTVSPTSSVCDGQWHHIELTNFHSARFSFVVDGEVTPVGAISVLEVSSELYFGGVPHSSPASERVAAVGVKTDGVFGGCIKNIRTSRKVDLLTDVASMKNADLGGCPRNRSVNITADTCRTVNSTLVYTGRSDDIVDSNLAPFTDYLYRVESKQPGTEGGGKSPWLAVRSGEGAPEYRRSPHRVTALDGGRSVEASWFPPFIYHGVLRGYILRAYNYRNSSSRPVEKIIDDVEARNATLSGLEPFTVYDVIVAAFTNGGEGESPGTLVTTKESVPEGVPVPDVERHPYSLFISWRRPSKPNGIITSYNLSIDGVLVYRGLNRTFNQTGLGVFSTHELKLIACTKIGCTEGRPITVYTAEIPPQGVSSPDVVILGAHSAEVRWKEPDSVNGIMLGYQVLLTKQGAPGTDLTVYNVTKDQFSLTIVNLTAGTWYFFRINAFNGGGGTLSASTRRRTVESSPEDIPKPDVRGLSPYSILVTIRKPRLPNGNITRYELFEVVGLNETVVLNGTSLNYTKTGLSPYTPYYFRSKACTVQGCGSSPIGYGFTLETAPNGTVSLNVSILNSTSALARWTGVHSPNGIVYYNLSVYGEFFVEGSSSFETENVSRVVASVRHPGREVLYSSLLPYASFRFQINASNSVGFILSNIVEGTTGEGAPVGLIAPNVTILNSTAARITWLPPARANGILLYYEITIKNLETNTSKNINNSLDMYFVVTDLEPYTTYQFRVAASTNGGKSWSPRTVITTFQDIPYPVDRPIIPRSTVDSRSLVVTWDHPTKPNGIIVRYVVYRNNSHRTTVSSNLTMLTVTNLEPFTIYTFSVSVCTVIGCSNSSLSRPVRTLEDVPEGQSSPVLSRAPGPSVLIRWSAPTVTNGKISEYRLQRRSEHDLSNISSLATVPANLSTEYLDDTVKPCTSYHYRVIAFTRRGGGTPSSWSNITTQEGAPDVVPSPTTRPVSSHAIHVTWSRAISQCTITGYIIRVLDNGKNYSGFGPSAPRNFTVQDLLPYKDYSIVVAGCVNTACRDSSPRVARTYSSLPRDQPPPSATPLDSRSLRVTWRPPRVPAGRILEFRLYRRTLDEPLSENFTTPAYYVLIYQGITKSFDDKGLGVFSLQQYKVMVINTEGNTTSNDSVSFRTGPVPPQAGALLSGLAINHTTVLLNWTLPELKLLRGYVLSYAVHYKDILENVEYTYVNDLDGTARSVIVSPLKPSRDYSFQVVLDNGAGTFGSNKIRVRTLDGAPEGFNKPDVRTINSTTIEVRWLPPSTPNGKITTYIIYANATRVGNTSALDFNVTSLIPFTVYVIQVEVCTVYACVRSESNSAKTLPAAPDLFHPPHLFPGPRNMIVVWDPPRRPNGVILEYKLFRRRLETCPTSPPPVTYCTYIECGLAEQLCGSVCYNPRTKICCNDVLYDRDPTKTCCDDKYLTKTSSSDVCCSGRFYPKLSYHQCCFGFYKLIRPGQICCKSSSGSVVVGYGTSCCEGTPYVNSSSYCVCGSLYSDPLRQCCGGNVVSRVQVCCGGTESNGRAYDQEPGKMCCGSDYVPRSSLCCKSTAGSWEVYNYSSVAERDSSGDQCCETNRINAGLSCCNGRGYNGSFEVCADKATVQKTGCGTGTTCLKSFQSTAMCNRCDFNQNTLYCGYVDGYYNPVSPTPPSDDCGSEFTDIGSGDAGFRSYDDQGLEPFTNYEYYVVARNTEGNVTSSKSRNTTLMDAPEGLSPPITTVLSARSIEIRFTPPSKPNGIVREYKLSRIDQSSLTVTLVYQGNNLSFVDSSGLRPFTGYLYILEACTSVCSNVTSQNIVYTMEAPPENVYPPMLRALSSSSIEVRWQQPGKPNGIIVVYNISRVNATNHTMAQWSRNGSMMVLVDVSVDLRPYTTYSYTVTACTQVGCTTSSRELVTTLEAAPEGLRPPVLIKRSARSVEAYWKEPDTPNGKITWYALYRGDTVIYNGTSVCQVAKGSTAECKYLDSGLSPHTWYSYMVEASTDGGSTKSNRSRVQTPESSPEGIPLPSLTPQSSSSVLVRWNAPANPNGVIVNYSVIVDTLLERPAGLGRQFTAIGLQPFTSYTFQIKACTVRGCGVGERASAKTLEAPPQGQHPPGLVALSDAIVKVTWRPPALPNGIIISYEVERSQRSSVPVVVFKTTLANGLRWQTLNSGLLPYRNYNYRIRAINNVGSTRSPWATVRTLEGAPSGLYAPVVHVLNATAVMASWQRPQESNGHITQYELWSRELDDPENKIRVARSPNVERNVTVGGLKPNTNYEFQLTARTIGGVGYSQWVLAETLEAPPLGLSSLRATKHPIGRELTLTWDEPSQPNGVITDYILYSDGVVVFNGISRECRLRRLQPFTAYTFQLEACTSAGCTRGRAQVITTAEILPERQQAPIFLNISHTSITVQWQPPALPYGEIRLYQVLRQNSQFAVYNTTDTNKTKFTYTDTNLEPFTQYSYKIRVQNGAGIRESSYASVTTEQASPEFVNAPILIPDGSSSVNISWSEPRKPNGIVIFYILRRNNTVVGQWDSKLSFNDISLTPATYYSYWLTVCTGGGCTDSPRSLVKTGESRPGAVGAPTLTVLSAIAIRAEWQPPVIANGLVIGYQLYMNHVQRYSGNQMSYVISRLEPFTTYTFYVSACTTRGCTPGDSNSATTHEARPANLAKPTYSVLGSNALEIKWTPPSTPNGMIKYYVLQRNGSVIYNGSDIRFNDLQVLPYRYYAYVVTAANSAGQVSSPALYTNRTSPGTPENVSKPVLTPLSGTEIRVTWLAPAKPNGKIREYLVLYNNIQVSVGLNMSYVAKNLNYYTEYSFRIRACTASSPCADSVETSARTLEGPPDGQNAPSMPNNEIKARSIFVLWTRPSSPNGVIERYLLQRRSVIQEAPGITITEVYSGLSFNYTDTSVVPFHTYEYRVLSENSVGQARSKWAQVTTRSAPPENVPAPRVLGATVSSIVVAIDPPGVPNGLIVDYKVEVNGENVSRGVSRERTIANLEPYVVYTMRVFACTLAGCTPSEAITRRTDTGTPSKVEEPTFGEVTPTSIQVLWQPPLKPNGILKRYFVVYKSVCSENCIRKRAVTNADVNVGLNTSYVITNLQPYTEYEIVIRVENGKFSADSNPVTKRTAASDPESIRKPVANITGDVIIIDWSKSFRLNGPLSEYVLEENGIVIFRGISTNSGDLPNRGGSEFVYVVSATTIVNGERRTVKSLPFTINISGGSPQSGGQSDPWYQTVWFLVVISVFIILAVFAVVALCLRRTSGDRTVYVRERDPLPVRAKSRSGLASMSSDYTPSEAFFNVGMNEFNLDTRSRTSTMIDGSEKPNKLDDSTEWEGYVPYGSQGNTGWFDDDKTWTDEDEPEAERSTKYQVFTDTHL